MADQNVEGYAGDLTPEETWEILKNEESAVLIDVRSQAEWSFVGVTDLSSLSKEALSIEWKSFPGMVDNPNFVDQVSAACPDKNAKIFSLCRSGQRSIATSKALTNAGFSQCYNILEGFEGDTDDAAHRGHTGGWKFRGLPWKQN